MNWLVWIVVLLAFVEGGWLAFDGGHALVTGDYVTPSSGPPESLRRGRPPVRVRPEGGFRDSSG